MSVDFIDTNIFVYLFDETAPAKRNTARELVHDALERGNCVISYQVVQETLNVLTRKLAVPVTPEGAREFLGAVLVPMWRVTATEGLFRRGLALQDRYRYAFYDALIIAAALEAGSARLYSEDLQGGQSIEGLTIVNPFAT